MGTTIKNYIDNLTLKSDFLDIPDVLDIPVSPSYMPGEQVWKLNVNDNAVVISPRKITLSWVIRHVVSVLVIYAISMGFAYLCYVLSEMIIMYIFPQLILLILIAVVLYCLCDQRKGNYFEWNRQKKSVILSRREISFDLGDILAFQVLERHDIYDDKCFLEILVQEKGDIIRKYPIIESFRYREQQSIAEAIAASLGKDLIHVAVRWNNEIKITWRNPDGVIVLKNIEGDKEKMHKKSIVSAVRKNVE